MENLRSRVLSLYRQVQAVSNVKKSIDQQTRLAKERTFTALRRVLDLRVYDEHVAEFRPAASHLVMQSARERKLVEMVEEKAQMTAELVQIASTLGETEAEPATLLRLTEIIQKLDLASQNAEKPIVTETDGVFTDFLSSLGKPDLLMSDLEKAIKIIDDELERSQSK
jgi:myosin heavy subunit